MGKLELLFLRIFREDQLVLSKLTDEEVVRLYRLNRDTTLIGELFTRYTHLVYGNCLHYLEDPEQAKDAVMHIFEGLFDALLKTEVRHFSSWLYQVSRNHCLMEIRKRNTVTKAKKQLSLEIDQAFMESPEEMHLNSEEEVVTHERLAVAMKSLNGEQRKCLELMYLEGKSYHQIVEITGLEWNAVKSYIQNGKRNLRKVLGTFLYVLLMMLVRW